MKRAFILYRNFLFACGLEKLLREEGVAVVGTGLDDRKTLDEIKMLTPDFVIAEAEREDSPAETLLSQLVRDKISAKVVRVSLEDNSITLYTGNRWTARTTHELVKGIVDWTTGMDHVSRRARR